MVLACFSRIPGHEVCWSWFSALFAFTERARKMEFGLGDWSRPAMADPKRNLGILKDVLRRSKRVRGSKP